MEHFFAYNYDAIAGAVSRRTGTPEKDVVRTLAFWTKHAPPDYKQDAPQDIALALLEHPTADPALTWHIAKRTIGHLWERWHTRTHYGAASLDARLDDGEGKNLADTIVDVVDYEAQVCGAIECSRLWGLLPEWVKECAQARLTGHNVNGRRSANLKQWALDNAPALLTAS